MAVTNVVGLPKVVVDGDAKENTISYTANEVFAAGDLIRITSAGTVKLAGLDTDTAGGIHGIALEAGAVGGSVTKVLLFTTNTVFSMPVADDTNPDDYPAGTLFPLDSNSATGVWALADSATKPFVLAVGIEADATPWTDVTNFVPASGTDNNGARVLCRIPQSVLDAAAA